MLLIPHLGKYICKAKKEGEVRMYICINTTEIHIRDVDHLEEEELEKLLWKQNHKAAGGL